jgi:hypothetical protein
MCELTARHGTGTAWARHALCESALSICPESHEDICLSLGSICTTLTMQARLTLSIDMLHHHKEVLQHTNHDTDLPVAQLGEKRTTDQILVISETILKRRLKEKTDQL